MIVIIGAGISGLTAARHLKGEYLILERDVIPGGLAGQFQAGDYWFDYAGHYFHFLNKEHIRVMVEQVCPFREFTRISKTFALGRYAPFPIQFHLSRLPSKERRRALAEVMSRPFTPSGNLHDYLELNFGETLFNIFFRPFLGKYYHCDLHELASDMDKGSIPPPDRERIAAGAAGGKFLNEGYNPVFYYPAGSLRAFISQYAAPLPPERIHYGETALEVDLRRRIVRTDKKEYCYDQLISTMPLKRLTEVMRPNKDFPAASGYRHVSTLVANAVLRRRRRRFHWTYIADADIPFYRVGFYPVHPAPACYLEKSVGPDFELNTPQVREEVLFTFKRLGLIEENNELIFMDARVIPVSYVLFTRDWREMVPPALERLKQEGVYSIGRYGSWNYTSMSDDMAGAIRAVAEINGAA